MRRDVVDEVIGVVISAALVFVIAVAIATVVGWLS